MEYSYVAHEPDELTLRKGDIIKDVKVTAGGWWEGTLRDKRGMFPDNFVKVIEPSPNSHSSKNETKINNGTIKKDENLMRNGGSSGRKYCKVLFNYEPCNEDELELMPQDSIEFLEEVEEGWWRGRLHGRVGVFPSNFVTSPSPEEAERPSGSIERTTKELCLVLFSYEALNEDELTINEGEIVTIISRNVADKGWWKGEIHGKIGLFPDNFVKLIEVNQDNNNDDWHDTNQSSSKSSSMKNHSVHKKSEKAHARKRLDLRSGLSNIDNMSSRKISDSTISSSSSSLSSTSTMSSSRLMMQGDLKPSSTTTSLKKINDNLLTETVDSLTESCINEELDGIERGEGAPLSHLTASRAKAPRRRLPSSQHVRGQTTTSINNLSLTNSTESVIDNNLTNGSIDTVDQIRATNDDNDNNDDDNINSNNNSNDNVISKTRRKTAPWMEELKMNQMEKRKSGINDNNKIDKPDSVVKKERSHHPRPSLPELPPKLINDDNNINVATVELRQKNKDKEINIKTESSNVSPTMTSVTMPSGTTPTYVPYKLFSQLLDRVVALEQKHTVLQQTVAQLTEQLGASSGAKKL